MKTVILGDPPPAIASLIAERQRLGLDTYDEVWEGEYHMAPAAAYAHGKTIFAIMRLFHERAAGAGREVGPAFNLGEPTNFRVPDIGVHRGTPSGTWFPTAGIVVEVRSPHDESLDKFGFYFDHGVEEVLIADLTSQAVQWHVRGTDAFMPADASAILGFTATDVCAALGW